MTSSINSRVNLMIFSNNIDYFDKNINKKIKKIAKKQIELGNIKIENIENSYNKILKFKKNFKPQLN